MKLSVKARRINWRISRLLARASFLLKSCSPSFSLSSSTHPLPSLLLTLSLSLSRAYVLQRASCCVETRPFFPSGVPSPSPSPPISLQRQIHIRIVVRAHVRQERNNPPRHAHAGPVSLSRTPYTPSREHPYNRTDSRVYAYTRR